MEESHQSASAANEVAALQKTDQAPVPSEEAVSLARKQIRRIADLYGLEVSFINPRVRSNKKLPIGIYSHPDHPQLTWTGRGRRPGWFVLMMEQGLKPEALYRATEPQ